MITELAVSLTFQSVQLHHVVWILDFRVPLTAYMINICVRICLNLSCCCLVPWTTRDRGLIHYVDNRAPQEPSAKASYCLLKQAGRQAMQDLGL